MRPARRGSALIIVLVMVVLLTVLILAYLLSSTADRKLSNSSLNQTIADQLARSAADVIIGDLKEEIFAPGPSSSANTITTLGPTSAPTTISIPKIYLSNTYSSMLPTRSGNPSLTGTIDPIPNLVRISNHNDPVGMSTTSVLVGSRASNASSSTASLNNRSVSAKRWNAHYLIPLQTTGTLTVSAWAPDSTPANSANFTVPDWVYVTGGYGPEKISTPTTDYQSRAVTVIGRYAYAIYDEGGLLDVNVAGSPSTISSTQGANKSSLALIDLTKLLDSNGNPLLTTAAADALVGWRNYASMQYDFKASSASTGSITGQFPGGFSLTSSNATNFFYNFGRGSSYAYLKANNLTSTGTMTDQLFLSRQQLISMQYALQQTVGFSPSALQYLTTFSRGLDQPSFTPDANRPKTVSYTSGQDPATVGTVGTNTASGNDDYINPSFLAVRVWQAASGARNDGTDLTLGDPLVKKRFALNRLAWITYKGPLADGLNVGTATTAAEVNKSDADLQKMAGYLHDNYGLSYAFLSKGTKNNIYNYFGLSWVADSRTTPTGNGTQKWFYNHSRTNAAGPFTALPSSGFGPIMRVGRPASVTTQDAATYVQDLGYNGTGTPREPDFFELLKAGIVAGSKGRTATLQLQPAAGGKYTLKALGGGTVNETYPFPDDYQNKLDSSLEFQVIQIGANIIEQSRLDGYTTQILFNDGSGSATKEFSGVENLPYVYGVRTGMVQGRAPNISNPAAPSAKPPFISFPTAPSSTATINDTGYSVAMQFPIVWNPHDQNSPRCAIDSVTGTFVTDALNKPLFPTSFRIVADSTDPDDITTTGTTNYGGIRLAPFNEYIITEAGTVVKTYPSSSNIPGSALSTPFSATQMGQLDNSAYFVLTAESTALTFTIDDKTYSSAQTFFREPTYLMSPNVPPNSSLKAGGSTNCLNPTIAPGAFYPPTSEFPSLQSSSCMDLSTGALLTTDSTGTTTALNLSPLLGFYLGTYPGAYYWGGVGNNYTYTTLSGTTTKFQLPAVPDVVSANFSPNINGTPITYRMQYETTTGSGTWVTYDSKFVASVSSPSIMLMDPTTFVYPSGTALATRAYCAGYDPRTSRFSMPFNVMNGAGDPPPGMSGALTRPGSYTVKNGVVTAGVPWSTNTSTTFSWLNTIASRTSGSAVVSNEIMTMRPDIGLGFYSAFETTGNATLDAGFPQANGWSLNNSVYTTYEGVFQINSKTYSLAGTYSSKLTCQTASNSPGTISGSFTPSTFTTPSQYYTDPDGVVRRAMGAYFTDASSTVSTSTTPGTYPGLPMATASSVQSDGTNKSQAQAQSRPIILHRPFRSVAELGYVFSGTPWKNLDFFTPESGDSPLLDVFCIDDSDNTSGLVAGKVNLNTRQVPVIQAILAGTYKDEQAFYTGNFNPSSSTYSSGYSPLSSLTGSSSATEANLIANALVARTMGGGLGKGPLVYVSDLVGRFTSGTSYDGFSADLASSVFTSSPTQSSQIQRFREAPIRSLAAVGQTRVWNLLIDVIAQKGRFPASASTLDNFYVEGEQRYWVHVAIDRFTGQVIDKQIEVVHE